MKQTHNWLNLVKPEVGYYIAGFADGEGSFNVSLRKRDDHKLGWQVVPSFNVSQRDRVILAFLKHTFGCGTLRTRKDGVVYFEVRNLHMLTTRVIPFFKRFGFRSSAKKRNFSLFTQIICILNSGEFNQNILVEIVQLREQLNEGRGRKRKYEARHVLGKSSETIRQNRLSSNTEMTGSDMI
ncbi:MAG: LAGLIDADG family homing endonuclease [Candidatus Magasanikbacteria bacterium]|nr:LAGLIDADG family homing endonuclease [Candidatus Magasanikbacteria bacterium]